VESRKPSRQRSSGRHELLACIVAATALVGLRTIVPVAYEQIFDSDQAIVGLMAKHLSELRAFPLFFYGQNYMLGVQAWLAAPLFRLGGPTVAMLRLPLALINVAVAILLITAFTRRGLRPVWAFVVALPIMATTPTISLELMSTLGASIEPFAYVLLLWALRRRPVVFGALFCVAVLHREFTVFVLPALALADRRRWSAANLARGAGAFAAVWVVVDVLKHEVNMFGPAGGASGSGSLILGPATIAKWLSFELDAYWWRLTDLLTQGGSGLLGAQSQPIVGSGIPDGFFAGSGWAGGAVAIGALVCVVRLSWLSRRSGRGHDAAGPSLPLYLALIAGQTMLVYGLNGGIQIGAPPVLRYFLFALLLPVALFGAYFELDKARRWRTVVAILVATWAGSNVWDNARLLRACTITPAAAHHRILADYLVANGIRYARGGYWDSYVVTFLSAERVIVASSDTVRITAYQALVDGYVPTAVVLRRQPCTNGRRVDVWCVDDP
jgi:hypothetical protein